MQNNVAKLRQSLTPLYDSREVKAIISLLMEEVCGISRVEMIMNSDRILDETTSAKLSQIATRLASGEPVQQVLGYEYFLGRKFEVKSDVLIPRPETAELVNWIVEDEGLRIKDEGLSLIANHSSLIANRSSLILYPSSFILDIGCGSGCIAISLAALINNSRVFGIDLSTGALITSRRNAQNLNISNVEFLQMDILASQNESFPHPDVDNFDIIVSNPPYIRQQEKAEMSANVLEHEPHMALFVPDQDPLLFYRAIANFGQRNLRPEGLLYFEINAALGPETCALLETMGYRNITLKKDINGRDRMIRAQK